MTIVEYMYNFGMLDLNLIITYKNSGINRYKITLTG